MTWAAVGAGAVSVAGSLYSNSAAKPDKVRIQPYNFATPFGDFGLTGGKDTVKGLKEGGTGFDTSLSQLFGQFGNQSLTAAQGISPQQVGAAPFDLAALTGVGGPNAVGSTPGSNAYSQAGQTALGALGDFNPDTFAQSAYDKLNAIAGPQENRAAQSLATRLFSQGRLGRNDTTAGRAFGDLALSQSQAADSRALSAYSLANQQQSQLTNQAGQFGALGQNLANANTNNLSQIFGDVRGDQFNSANFANQLRTLLGQQGSQAIGAQGSSIDQFLALVNGARSGQNAVTSTALGQAPAQNEYRASTGDMYGQIFSGLSNSIGKMNFGAPQNTGEGIDNTVPWNP